MNNSEVFTIKEVTNVHSGVVLQKTANLNVDKLTNTFVLMLMTSDFDEDGILLENLKPNALYKSTLDKYFLKKGDVLFNAKGRRFFAVVYNCEYENAVPGSSFHVLKVRDQFLSPEFLAWYLNHPETMKEFSKKLSTQNMPMVTKKELEDLKIYLPPLEVQDKIVGLANLNKSKNRIQKKLIGLNETLINAITYNKIKNEY